jgi:hypothetical protein
MIDLGGDVTGNGMVEDAAQQRAIRRIIELRWGGLSLRGISAAIAAEGVKLSHEGVK